MPAVVNSADVWLRTQRRKAEGGTALLVPQGLALGRTPHHVGRARTRGCELHETTGFDCLGSEADEICSSLDQGRGSKLLARSIGLIASHAHDRHQDRTGVEADQKRWDKPPKGHHCSLLASPRTTGLLQGCRPRAWGIVQDLPRCRQRLSLLRAGFARTSREYL